MRKKILLSIGTSAMVRSELTSSCTTTWKSPGFRRATPDIWCCLDCQSRLPALRAYRSYLDIKVFALQRSITRRGGEQDKNNLKPTCAALGRQTARTTTNIGEPKIIPLDPVRKYGGGGGSRTPVRKALRHGAYMLISVQFGSPVALRTSKKRIQLVR